METGALINPFSFLYSGIVNEFDSAHPLLHKFVCGTP